MKSKLLPCAIASIAMVALAAINPIQADPIDVTYSVTGSAGSWVLDFSVTNNLGGTNDIYFFGVSLTDPNNIGGPAFWNPVFGNPTYNNLWSTGAFTGN